MSVSAPRAVLIATQRQLDPAALRRVRDRIGHQVGQHPHERPIAADHPNRLGRQIRRQDDPGSLRCDAVRGHQLRGPEHRDIAEQLRAFFASARTSDEQRVARAEWARQNYAWDQLGPRYAEFYATAVKRIGSAAL